MRFYCNVRGMPVAQGRARAFRAGDSIRMYDPENSKQWKQTVAIQCLEKHPQVMSGALSMKLYFFLPRPRSLPKKIVYHTKRPDLDNLVKAVKDALRGICYKDDSQIVHLIATKDYGDTPGVMIEIEEKNE